MHRAPRCVFAHTHYDNYPVMIFNSSSTEERWGWEPRRHPGESEKHEKKKKGSEWIHIKCYFFRCCVILKVAARGV